MLHALRVVAPGESGLAAEASQRESVGARSRRHLERRGQRRLRQGELDRQGRSHPGGGGRRFCQLGLGHAPIVTVAAPAGHPAPQAIWRALQPCYGAVGWQAYELLRVSANSKVPMPGSRGTCHACVTISRRYRRSARRGVPFVPI